MVQRAEAEPYLDVLGKLDSDDHSRWACAICYKICHFHSGLEMRDKMAAPGKYTKWARSATSSAFFRPKRYTSKDFIVYSCVPEEL